MTRNRASMFGDFVPSTKAKKELPIEEEVKKVSEEAGFTTRHSPEIKKEPKKEPEKEKKIDGRSLRAKGKNAQLNMAVRSEVRERFWLLAQEEKFESGEDLIVALMNKWEEKVE